MFGYYTATITVSHEDRTRSDEKVALWSIFFAMLLVIETLFLHWCMQASPDPGRDFRRMDGCTAFFF